jgi:hypothetical protein
LNPAYSLTTSGVVGRALAARPVERLRPSSTPEDRLSLVALTLVIPFQEALPTLGRFSVAYVVFALVLLRTFLVRNSALRTILRHRAVAGLFALIGLGTLVEAVHPHRDFESLRRLGEMTLGLVLVAALCTDRKAIRALLFALMADAFVAGLIVFLSSYGALRSATAADYEMATRLRGRIFEEQVLGLNLNNLAIYIGLGAVTALGYGLSARGPVTRLLCLAVGSFCLVCAFLPMSRSGMLATLAGCALVVLRDTRHRGPLGRAIQLLVLVVVVLTFVPQVTFARFTWDAGTRTTGEFRDSRTQVYGSAAKHVTEYALFGVGAGDFKERWAADHGFWRSGGVEGAHNSYLQILINWGLIALLPALYITARMLTACRQLRPESFASTLQGVALVLVLGLCVSHVFYAKHIAVVLGCLVGASHWLGTDDQQAAEPDERVQFGNPP